MNGEDLSDEQLMLMFRYGNRAAFGLLFEKHRTPIYNFGRRMLGRGRDAEDVCQDVFLRVVTSAGTYEPTARFRTWLFTIARNCCISALRRKRPIVLDLDKHPATSSGGAEDDLAGSELAELLESAIATLPEDWREAFLLRRRESMSYDEIAEVTGRPSGTVKTHVHRARLRLAEMMAKHLGAE